MRELTAEVVAGFVGGEAEIQNQAEGYLYRGRIESAAIEDGHLVLGFSRVAKCETHGWVAAECRPYRAHLQTYLIVNVSEGRICMQGVLSGEFLVLFPPDQCKFNWDRVQPVGKA